MSYVDALCRCGSILNLKPNTFEYIPSFKQTGNEICMYDRKRKPALKYQVGDHVVISSHVVAPGVNKKLLPKFKAPYVMIKVLDNDRCRQRYCKFSRGARTIYRNYRP